MRDCSVVIETYSFDSLACESVDLDDESAGSYQVLANLFESLVSRLLNAELRGVEGNTRGDDGTRLDSDGLSRGDSDSLNRSEGKGGEGNGEELGLHFGDCKVAFSTREDGALRRC